MGRGRQSRQKVATRVRNARELALFEKTLSVNQIEQAHSRSPSERLIATSRYLTSGLFSGMREAERRIQLHAVAVRRKQQRTIFQKAFAKPRENSQREADYARRARKSAMQIRSDARRKDDFDEDYITFDEVNFETLEIMTGMAPDSEIRV